MGRAFFYLPVPIVGASASSSAPSFDPANVANDHMGVVYKSAGAAASVSLVVDLGSPQVVDTALFFGCTGAKPEWTLKVESADSAAFTSGVTIHETGAAFLAGAALPTHGRGVSLWMAASPPAAKRYWRFTIAGLANAQVTIARIAIGQRIALARNFTFGGAWGVRDLGRVDFSSAGVRLLRQAAKLRTIGLTFPAVTKEEAEAKVQSLVEQAAGQLPIVLVTDPDAHPLRQRRCWFGHLTGELGTIWRSAQAWEWRASLIDLVPIPVGAGGAIDATEPSITSPETFTVDENVALNQTATADAPVTWSKGGVDADLVTLNSATGAWSLAAQDYEARHSVSFVLIANKKSNGLSAIQPITVTIGDVVEGGSDTTPDAFTFTDVTGVAIGSAQASNWVPITGITAPASWTTTGGLAQVADSDTGTNASSAAASGTVAPDKWMRVTHTSSGSNSTPTNTTLTIGGVSDTFTSTTAAASGPVAAPTLTWTSGTADYDPTFTVTGIQQGDVVTLEIDNNSDFSSLYGTDTNTIDLNEAADGQLSFPAIPTLGYATTYYARARITRGGQVSPNSAVQSKAMDAQVILPAQLVEGIGLTGAGADKSRYLDVQADGLTFSGNADQGALNGARSTTTLPVQSHWEVSSVSITGGAIWIGIAGSEVAFGPSLFPNVGSTPHTGFRAQIDGGGLTIKANNDELAFNVGGTNDGSETWAVGYDYSDPAAPTGYIKRRSSGGTVQTFGPFTLTTLIPATPTAFVAGANSGNGGVVNFGATAFLITPNSGHVGL